MIFSTSLPTALRWDSTTIALAAVGELEEERRQLERQRTLQRERAQYKAERARRQYDIVEPENRLVARSLERVWEEKLRIVDMIEQEHARSRPGEPISISETRPRWKGTRWAMGTATSAITLSCLIVHSTKLAELVRQGKTSGITANSHKVIRNLIDETIKVADKLGIELQCCYKTDEVE